MVDLPPCLVRTDSAKGIKVGKIVERSTNGTDEEELGIEEQRHGPPSTGDGEVSGFLSPGVPVGPNVPKGIIWNISLHLITF